MPPFSPILNSSFPLFFAADCFSGSAIRASNSSLVGSDIGNFLLPLKKEHPVLTRRHRPFDLYLRAGIDLFHQVAVVCAGFAVHADSSAVLLQ
jgi:hypothetical protein